jgi:hypothetical protein
MRARFRATRAAALYARFETTGTLADLDAAITAYEAWSDATPVGHAERAASLGSLGNALRMRYERTGDQADLDAAIEVGQAALEAAPAGHRYHILCLSNLGLALQERFECIGAPADLDDAIEANQTAVESTPVGHPDRLRYLSNLGNALRVRYERTGDQADLDAAIEAGQAAVDAVPADHPYRPAYLSNLGNALLYRFLGTGTLAHLDAAISNLQAAADATSTGHPDQAKWLSNLGNALQVRYERTRDEADLDRAIEAGQAAVDAVPADHPYRPAYLSNLGNALLYRFLGTGTLAHLDAAISNLKAGLTGFPVGHPERAKWEASLGNALLARFVRVGESADLDAAIGSYRAALAAVPVGYLQRVAWLANLGNTLRIRFEQTGELADLDAAIKTSQAAVDATTAGHPFEVPCWSNLGLALQARFERTGALTDLDAAIDHNKAAVAAILMDHPNRPRYLSNLGNALRVRFERVGTLGDLDAAIEASQAAVDASQIGSPERAMYLCNLGLALQARFERIGALADLNAAIEASQAAVDIIPNDQPDRSRYLSNLGNAQRERFERTGKQADLDTAIANLQAAVDSIHLDFPEFAYYLFNLGLALRGRFDQSGAQVDRISSLSAFTQATESDLAPPSIRIRAAREAAGLVAESDAGRAADLLEVGIRLMPEIASRQLERSDRQYALGGFAGLAADAAALALADVSGRMSSGERAERALALLEAGRAVLLSQALDTRSDLTDLRRMRPDLAARLTELRDTLDQRPEDAATESSLVGETHPVALPDRPRVDRHQLASELATVLEQIRTLDGFASFGRPPTLHDLLVDASEGPVITFSISPYRSDALLLAGNRVTALPLPGLPYNTVTWQIDSFYNSLDKTVDPAATFEERLEAEATLSRILEWLWDSTAEPVLHALGYDERPAPSSSLPRVWWVPGGLLSLLPIHAAGYHTAAPSDHVRRTVMDRVISSYTPTVRALRYARQRVPAAVAHSLVVAMPTTPGLPGGKLPNVPAEIEKIRPLLPDPLILAEPGTTEEAMSSSSGIPTRASVFAHLPHCSIAHFACHGTVDPADPSQSLLLLHDHDHDPLTVASLAPVNLAHAQLAYLSACRTAFSAVEALLDEAIHLATAFQLAGFPHVIGTLWEINDQIAVEIAESFYKGLHDGAGDLAASQSACALHHAVCEQRDRYPRTPSLWAAYMHAGS